jgi:hypothetical protein
VARCANTSPNMRHQPHRESAIRVASSGDGPDVASNQRVAVRSCQALTPAAGFDTSPHWGYPPRRMTLEQDVLAAGGTSRGCRSHGRLDRPDWRPQRARPRSRAGSPPPGDAATAIAKRRVGFRHRAR